jgi:hypothetical protein
MFANGYELLYARRVADARPANGLCERIGSVSMIDDQVLSLTVYGHVANDVYTHASVDHRNPLLSSILDAWFSVLLHEERYV